MAKFIVYTYQFTPLCNNGGDSPIKAEHISDLKAVMQEKQSVFQSLFDEDSGLAFSYKGQPFNHQILLRQEGFIILRIANKITLYQEENFQVRKIESQPSCVLIIDNRPDCQTIAIQQFTDAFSNTDVVARILTSTFKETLAKYNLSIEIQRRIVEQSFWDLVEKTPEGIKSIRIDVSYPNLPRVSDKVSEIFTSLNRELHANSVYEINALEQNLVLDKDNNQINELVKAACDSGHQISVKSATPGSKWTFAGVESYMYFVLDDRMFSGNPENLINNFAIVVEQMNLYN